MGIIGFEMITEKTPFHNDNVFDTYSEIQNFSDEKQLMQILEFPEDVKMSRNLKDLLSGLITKPSRRMAFDEIEDHPFFRGVDWRNLRDQPPPIIPTLDGDEDTSNFEDVDKSIKREPVLKKTTFNPYNVNEFSGEDLQFLGYTYIFEESSKFLKTSSKASESKLESKLSKKIGGLQETIEEQMREIKLLQKDLLQAERKAAQMCSLEKIYEDTKEDMDSMKIKLKEKVAELASSKTEIKTLKSKLKIEEEMRLKNDSTISDVISQTYQKWEKARKISDANFEKQLSEKKSEINSLLDRIKTGETELSAKIDECQHLNSIMEKYKDMLKSTKDQHSIDKNENEDARKKLSTSYEVKLQDLKNKLNLEKDLRVKSAEELEKLRKQLNDAFSSQTNFKESNEQYATEITAIRKQLGEKIDENNRLMKGKKDLQQQIEDVNHTNDELRKEMLKLQEENFKKQLRLSKTVSQPITVGGRVSSEGEFLSAHGSLTELDVVDPEDLKNDLARAKENEDVQRKRADNLEQLVQRLDEMVKQVQRTTENTAGGFLERQNLKLEDQLAAAREEFIVERQATKTALLQLYKLEKEVSELKNEKERLLKRVEIASEKTSSAVHDKESIELKMKQQLETIKMKETLIIELQTKIRRLESEVKQEREKHSSYERERLREKTDNIEKGIKIKNLEDKMHEASNKIRLLELKVSSLSDEKSIIERRLTEECNLHSSALEAVSDLQNELEMKSKNYDLLVEAAATTESQLTQLEEMWNSEVKINKANSKKIDDLCSKIRSRDDEITKMKRELAQEKALKSSAEAKGCQLQNEYDELKEEMLEIQKEILVLKDELAKKQESLYEAQENVEVTNSDLQHLQKLKTNYENEIRSLKEESTRILTDYFRTKEDVKRLINLLKESQSRVEEATQEKNDLSGELNELKTHSRERDILTKETVAQHKKLIEYLNKRVEELQSKKKRTIAEVLFGGNSNTPLPPATPKSTRKENVPSNSQDSSSTKLKKIEDDLKRERERNHRLKENLMQTKLEIRKSASMKSPEKAISRESTVETLDINGTSSHTITATIHAEPEIKVENDFRQREPTSSPKSHHFAMTIETASPSPNAPSTMCLSCQRTILIGQPYWQCKECKLSVHRKCRTYVVSHCLLGDGISSSGTSSTAASTASINGSRRSGGKKINLDDVDGIKPFADDVSSIGSGSDMVLNNYQGEHILNSSRFGFGWGIATAPKINAVYELTENIILFGKFLIVISNNSRVHFKCF